MPTNAENIQKAIEATLNVKCSIQDAEKVASSVDRVRGSFRQASEEAQKFEKGMAALGTINNSIASTFSKVGNAVGAATGFVNASNLTIKAGYDIHIKYNDAIRQTSVQFAKYSIGVTQYQSKVEGIRKAYQLTYPEATKLMSSLEKGFNVTGPEKFEGYMKSIGKITGHNIDAMNEFSDAILAMTANNPALEKLIGNLNPDWEGAKQSALEMLSAGEINMQQYKKFQDAVAAQSRTPEEQSKLDEISKPGITARGLAQGVESGLKTVGETTANIIQGTVDWAGGIDKVNEKIAASLPYYIAIQTAVGAITSAFSGLSGAASGALDVLDAAADLKILGGGSSIKGVLNTGKAGLSLGRKAFGAGRALLGAAPGAASINGMGAAALGGSGAAIAGSGALMAGAAIGGFEAGDYIANKTGIGIYGWSNQMGADAARTMDMANRTEDPVKKAQLRAAALASKADQEKMESLGGFTGMFRSEGVASDETLKALQEAREELKQLSAPIAAAKKAQEELNAAEARMTPIEKQNKEEKQKQEKVLEDIGSRIVINKQNLEVQRNVLQSSNSLLSSQATLFGKASRTDLIKTAVDANNLELDSAEKLANEKIALQKEVMKNSTDPNDANAKKAKNELIKLEEELNQITLKRNANAKVLVDSNQSDVENQEKAIGLSEANIALQDSAGMGLKAQVGARKQLIDQITTQIQMVQQQADAALQQRTEAEAALKKAEAAGNEKGVLDAKSKIRDMDNEILDKNTKITNLIQKQADVSKAMREGWISAISAMTTGAGVFSRIVIDQNKRLGNLAFSSPDSIKALRIGGTTGGRKESSQWTPGGMNYGKSGANEEAIMSQYGIDPNSTLQEQISAHAARARTMSPAAAAAGVGPQAMGELTGAIKENTEATRKIGSGPKMIIEEKDIEDIKRSFVDAFSKIGNEIVTETLKRIRNN